MFYFEDTTMQSSTEENDDQLLFLHQSGRDESLNQEPQTFAEVSPEEMLERIRQLM